MVIGITGGVGCGKSTVLNILEQDFGCYIIEADKVAHLLMEPKNPAYIEIVHFFGTNILSADTSIDRKKLGEIVFHDSEKLSLLNSIVHPAVKTYIVNQITKILQSDKNAVIVIEAALLLEDHYDEICDEIWYIYTKEDVRIQRLRESRGYTEDKTRSIMKNQMSEEFFNKHCDKKVDNSNGIENTRKQINDFFANKCGGNICQT